MSLNKQFHEDNRISWNEATKVHNSHKGDQAKFLRDGGTTLYSEEVVLLGDIKDTALLHLQCNSGQDTLSIAKHLGAICTGVDISDEAIAFAKKLSNDADIPATFIRSDIYDFFDTNEIEYDVVFMSYGTLVWLSDLDAWAKGVTSCLKSGGKYVLVEFHPMLNMYDNDDDLTRRFDYSGGTHQEWEDGVGDYVGASGEALLHDGIDHAPREKPFINPHKAHEFSWGLGDILGALCSAGLYLTHVEEYPYSNGFKPFPDMQSLDGKRFTTAADKPNMPLMFSVVATKI